MGKVDAELFRESRIERIAKRICSETCAAKGIVACFSHQCHREDAMEWPNPFCDKPGCHALALAIMEEFSWLKKN